MSDILLSPLAKIESKNKLDLWVAQEVKDILDLNASENINFQVFQTIFTSVLKWKKYIISTDWLNGCTASFILLKNLAWAIIAVISTHFPPIEGMIETSLNQIQKHIKNNSYNLQEVSKIEIFLANDTSRPNNHFLLLSDFIEQTQKIVPKTIISYYNRRDKTRSDAEKIWTMNLEISSNGSYRVSHEWNILI